MVNNYVYGELIEVRDTDSNLWTKERFLCFSLKNRVVTEDDEGIASVWLQHRSIEEEVEITLKEVADKFGLYLHQVKIVEK